MQNLCWHDIQLTQATQAAPLPVAHLVERGWRGLQGECIT